MKRFYLHIKHAKLIQSLSLEKEKIFTLFVICLIWELSTSFTRPSFPGDNDTLATTQKSVNPIILSELYLQNYSKDSSLLKQKGYEPYSIPSFSDKEYEKRFKSLANATIPLPYNKFVRGYIDLYLYRKRCLATKIVGRSYDYFPLFEEKLKSNHLPVELKNLAIVESALKEDARSFCGATGLWQFMETTARCYKLKIDSITDERKIPERATDAAVNYLKDLHSIYNDWLLAIAAYNCGPGNVNKALKKARRYYRHPDFWSIKKFLPLETQGYVPAFVASCYMMKYYGDHNIKAINPTYLQSEVKPLPVRSYIHFEELSKFLPMTPEEISYFNPDYETSRLIHPEDTIAKINLPVSLHALFQKNESEIYKNSFSRIFPALSQEKDAPVKDGNN